MKLSTLLVFLQQVGEVKDFQICDLQMKTCSNDRYNIFETEINYSGIDQKWLVVDSREMQRVKLRPLIEELMKSSPKHENR